MQRIDYKHPNRNAKTLHVTTQTVFINKRDVKISCIDWNIIKFMAHFPAANELLIMCKYLYYQRTHTRVLKRFKRYYKLNVFTQIS